MKTEPDFRPVAYVLIVAGCMLAFVSAVVPHYTAGHRLLFGALLVGLIPYFIYGALTQHLLGWALLIPGILVVTAHLWLVVTERFIAYDGFANGAIYYVPLVLAAVVLPLGIAAGHQLNKVTWKR